MVQQAFSYIEQITDMDVKLKLIDTLRTVTAGKVSRNVIVVIWNTLLALADGESHALQCSKNSMCPPVDVSNQKQYSAGNMES